jgi:cytochrome c
MSKTTLRFLAVLVGASASSMQTSAQTSSTAPAAFAPCAVCHSPDGGNGFGPSLKGVVGRKAGSADGFNYSRAMKNANITWDEGKLDAFIAEPQKVVPGNHMPFSGLAEQKQRASIVEFLKTLR